MPKTTASEWDKDDGITNAFLSSRLILESIRGKMIVPAFVLNLVTNGEEPSLKYSAKSVQDRGIEEIEIEDVKQATNGNANGRTTTTLSRS